MVDALLHDVYYDLSIYNRYTMLQIYQAPNDRDDNRVVHFVGK